ncbi:hypothetical protein AB0F82_29990 [Streptomyces virginiae]
MRSQNPYVLIPFAVRSCTQYSSSATSRLGSPRILTSLPMETGAVVSRHLSSSKDLPAFALVSRWRCASQYGLVALTRYRLQAATSQPPNPANGIGTGWTRNSSTETFRR